MVSRQKSNYVLLSQLGQRDESPFSRSGTQRQERGRFPSFYLHKVISILKKKKIQSPAKFTSNMMAYLGLETWLAHNTHDGSAWYPCVLNLCSPQLPLEQHEIFLFSMETKIRASVINEKKKKNFLSVEKRKKSCQTLKKNKTFSIIMKWYFLLIVLQFGIFTVWNLKLETCTTKLG